MISEEEWKKYRQLPRGLKLSVLFSWIIILITWLISLKLAVVHLEHPFSLIYIILSAIIFLLLFFHFYPKHWKWAWDFYEKKRRNHSKTEN